MEPTPDAALVHAEKALAKVRALHSMLFPLRNAFLGQIEHHLEEIVRALSGTEPEA